MKNLLLYAATIVLWGASWYAIRLQLTTVAPEVSIFYRFAIAAAVLFAYCLLRNKPMQFSLGVHVRFVLLGLFLFNLNFLLIYLAAKSLATGLISVVFSIVQIFNMLNGAMLLKDRITPGMVIGALMGIGGIALVFMPELTSFAVDDAGFAALLLALGGTLSASFGMIGSAAIQRQSVPVLQSNAWGMLYGSILMLIYVGLRDLPLGFDSSISYVGSLLYLAIFASVIAFGCFLTLVGRIGAAKASYATVLFPIIALALSTWAEGYQWSALAAAGVVLTLAGNAVILLDKSKARS